VASIPKLLVKGDEIENAKLRDREATYISAERIAPAQEAATRRDAKAKAIALIARLFHSQSLADP
jgi:hypothetical protein